jgi:3,4-dihydroxy 2-butanone 4-phosphate synthase/GTP cyclohydrolase II
MGRRVREAIAAIAAGRPVVVTDHHDREDEADLVVAADAVDDVVIAFMAVQCRGLICLALEPQRLDELDIDLMVPGGKAETNFTVSIDLDVPGSTGISAADRAGTIRRAINPNASAADFRRPGHVFPLRYAPGGVLTRPGHTEASVDLARLAGRAPGAAICEIMNDDGTMARGAQVVRFAERHGFPVVSIAEIIEFVSALSDDAPAPPGVSVEEVATTVLPTEHGRWTTTGYRDADGLEYVVLTMESAAGADGRAPLVRIHSECLTGDALGSERCDCGGQLTLAKDLISAEGSGTIVYVRGHEGRGIGLLPKLEAYALQDRGLDTVDANLELGFEVDARSYRGAAAVLAARGVHRVRLLTNNPRKVAALEAEGIEVVREPLLVRPSTDNVAYLASKRRRLDHQLPPAAPALLAHTAG